MEEIKAIVKKHDIGAMVVLHTPGHSEYYMNISPSYSCAKQEGDTVRIKAKLKDFNGDKKAWEIKVTDTSNLLTHLGETGARTAMSILNVSKQLDQVIDAEHFGGGHSSHTEQNN